MSLKKVSVIIPNYNYGRYLSEAVESVLNQNYKNLEVIVVNNGSTDNSLEVLKTFGNRIKVVDQPNLGQSGARNTGLDHAVGEYIAFLDADDYWHPKKIEKQVSLLNNNTQLVYCGISRFDKSDNKIISQILPHYRGRCSDFFLTQPGVSIVLSGESTAIFSRALFEQVGNFDGNLNSAAGWDFFRRCSKLTEFDFVPEPLTYYRVHDNNMSNSNTNNISDIRKAYNKLFTDNLWLTTKPSQRKILIALEITFLKTYIKEMDPKNSLLSLKLLWDLSRSRIDKSTTRP